MQMEDTTELTRAQLDYLPPVAVARSGYAAGYNSQKPHIMEVFCPPRFSLKSRNYGIYPSLAFDLTIGWDLNDPHVIKFMWKVIEKIQPLMIFGSPNCGSFSVLANLNKNRPKYETKKAEKIAHLKIVEELYHYQMRKGRYFCHEHPENASSWKLDFMEAFRTIKGVEFADCDQCMYG